MEEGNRKLKLPERNYFTLERVSPDDLKLIEKVHSKMLDLGIIRKLQDPKNLELNEEDQKWEFTESFESYMKDSLKRIFWHRDLMTGELKKFGNPKKAKEAKRREEEYEKMRKMWVDNGGDSDKFHEFHQIATLTDIILEFKVVQEILDRIYEKDPNRIKPVKLPMDKILDVVDSDHKNLTEAEKHEYEDMARLIYGCYHYRYDSKIDKMLAKKLVNYEIMTDTGHLTRYFMDVIKDYAEYSKKTMEQVVKDENMLCMLIIESTRDEDYDNVEEYLNKKSNVEMNEYYEMARIVGRLLKMELVKQREEVQ